MTIQGAVREHKSKTKRDRNEERALDSGRSSDQLVQERGHRTQTENGKATNKSGVWKLNLEEQETYASMTYGDAQGHRRDLCMTSRRLPVPSPGGGKEDCCAPNWAVKRPGVAQPPAPRRRAPASARDKQQDRKTDLQPLRAPRTPHRPPLATALRHVRNKRWNRHMWRAAVWVKMDK